MDSRRTRRLLLIAFALSLLVHLIVAWRVHWPFAGVSREESATVRIVHVTRITHIAAVPPPRPHTPPPNTPPPQTPPPSTPPPVKVVQHPRAVHVPRVSKTTTASPAIPAGGAGTGHAPVAVASATPSPVAVASVAPCANSDSPATLAASPPPPDLSPQARADAVSGTVRIRVALDAQGRVAGTSVVNSSGSGSLDLAAVGMARDAQYTPAQHDCKAVASTYMFSVKFVSW